MSVLVVHGSKRGGTEGLALMVADALRHEGFTVEDWRDPKQVQTWVHRIAADLRTPAARDAA
jgi:flavodoxin